jgi:hypothetical protein
MADDMRFLCKARTLLGDWVLGYPLKCTDGDIGLLSKEGWEEVDQSDIHPYLCSYGGYPVFDGDVWHNETTGADVTVHMDEYNGVTPFNWTSSRCLFHVRNVDEE